MTLPACHTWPDFDNDGNDTGATVIGRDSAIAIVLYGPHRDAFVRLALAASDMQTALKLALEALSAVPNYPVPGQAGGSYAIASLCEQALAKAKGE